MPGLPSQAISRKHRWVVAATIVVSETLARQGDRRGTVRLDKEIKVDVLETYCEQCRKPYDRVAGQPCEAAVTRDHLIGGPTGERKKRKGEAEDPVEVEAEQDEFALV